MKKNIAILLSIIALILFVLLFKVTINKDNKILGGKSLGNGLYLYDIKLAESYLDNFTVIDNEIYYLVTTYLNDEEANYDLYKINIYTNVITKVNELSEKASYCYLKEEQIICEGSDKITLYDFALQRLAEATISNEEYIQYGIIPYKDNYLLMENNNLYLLKNSKRLFRTIEELECYNYIDYYKTNDNTYLLFSFKDIYYIYDINENVFTVVSYSNFGKYANGFYFLSEEIIKIIDLKSNKEIEYPNFLTKTDFHSGIISQDNEKLYIYDENKGIIYIENLKKETIIEYSISLNENNIINNMYVKENMLYLSDTENNIYIINLDEVNQTEQNIADYKAEEEELLRTKIEAIKEEYNVNIKIKDESNIEYPDFYAEEIKDNTAILNALTDIETVLSKFKKEFFDSFYDLDYDGLNIYLTGTLTPSDYESQISNPAAFSLVYNNEYMIVLDIEQYNIEQLTCHELEHNLENNSNYHNQIIFEKWDELNPKDFYYTYSYTDESNVNYTLSENNKENVYFIDIYAHTYPTEDRARVFEYVCAPDNEINLEEYPNLNAKAQYLEEEIIKSFPYLKNSLLFNN